jgi:hypothetical protein
MGNQTREFWEMNPYRTATGVADQGVWVQKDLGNGVRIQAIDEPAYGAHHLYRVGEGESAFTVGFQRGPIQEVGINGCQQEDLLAIVIHRLEAFQATEYGCRENQEALRHCQEAIMWLDRRTLRRRARAIEGLRSIEVRS